MWCVTESGRVSNGCFFVFSGTKVNNGFTVFEEETVIMTIKNGYGLMVVVIEMG